MMTNKTSIAAIILSICLSACAAQNAPSMMNADKPELVEKSHIDQIPAHTVNETTLSILADQYRKYGNGPLELTMTFDPSSKTYTAMKAVRDLKSAQESLAKKGITEIKTSTLAVAGEQPTLMVSYPSVYAQAPSKCGVMPGLEDFQTTRFVNGYRFGCSTETFLARQIARPADLQGRGAESMGSSDARRIVGVMETYNTLNDRQQSGELEDTLERDQVASD